MTPSLINHEKWSPSIKRFYNQYHSTAKFTGFSWTDSLKIDYRWEGKYRSRNAFGRLDHIFRQFTRDFTIYTNSFELLEELLADPYWALRLDYVATPKDTDHQKILEQTDEKVVFKSKPFYNKYYYKMYADINYYRNPPNTEMVNSAVEYVNENFKDSRVVYTDGRVHMARGWFSYRSQGNPYNNSVTPIPKFPTVYTNDEAQIFLFKLSHQTDLNIKTERVVIV